VSINGSTPDPAKLEAIAAFPTPTDLAHLRRFLGMTGYYRKFVPFYARIADPLYALTRADTLWQWGEETDQAFRKLKNSLCEQPVLLASPDGNKPFVIHTDASGTAIAGVLYQLDTEGNQKVVAYASRRLNIHERNYTVSELECLAVVWAVTEQFHSYIFGAPFLVETDHSALTSVFTCSLCPTREPMVACNDGHFGCNRTL